MAMLEQPIVAVILAGGSGERFWPLSTPERPKQLLRLLSDDKSLLEEAIERASAIFGEDRVYVATGSAIAAGLGPEIIGTSHVLIEPGPKNTLGAIIWAISQLRTKGYADDTVMAVLTADHAIESGSGFTETVRSAIALAQSKQGLVTIGIPPTRPETGFGYIEVGEECRALRFTEKPPLEQAQSYVESGRYLWNSGMFFWTIGTFARELKRHAPRAAAVLEHPDGFNELESISVDRAVLERSDQVFVIPARFSWDDVGSWDALDRIAGHDEAGNVLHGPAAQVDTSNSIVFASGVPVSVLGVHDLIVVATAEGVLVCHKSEAQRVREVVAKLKQQH